MSRRIIPCSVLSYPFEPGQIDDMHTWLAEQAGKQSLTYLLAHSDEGVIWGRMAGKILLTSHKAASEHPIARKVCSPLNSDNLQQARLFSLDAELMLWRVGKGWYARLIRNASDGETPLWTEAFDEPQVLWGTVPQPLKDDFMFWTEGAQGLRHALPLADIYIWKTTTRDTTGQEQERQEPRPPRLRIRHYLSPEDTARIAASRLVGFDTKWEKQS